MPLENDEAILDEKLYSIGETANINGRGISTEYWYLAQGRYDPAAVIKDGTRTKIYGWGIKKHRREHFKPANFKAPKLQGSRFHTISRG
jgi:hypothetical protein